MIPARPLYLFAPSDVSPPGLGGLFPGREAERLGDVAQLRERAPGLLLLPMEAIRADDLVAALMVAQEGPSESGWLPVLLQGGTQGRAAVLLPVSLGWPADPVELTSWLDGADDVRVFELRHVLARVSRGRHDLNNPLTSAMAEIQLALLDANDPALREGLETVEAQLRRIRDLVAALRSLRPPG